MYGTKWHFSHLSRTECLFCTVENGIWGFLTVVGRIFPFFGKDTKTEAFRARGPPTGWSAGKNPQPHSREEPAAARQSEAHSAAVRSRMRRGIDRHAAEA